MNRCVMIIYNRVPLYERSLTGLFEIVVTGTGMSEAILSL